MPKKNPLSNMPINIVKSLYWNDKKSLNEIATLFECSLTAVRNFMIKNEIEIRTFSEANTIVANSEETQRKRREKLCGRPSGTLGRTWKWPENDLRRLHGNRGENNPCWKGGISKDIEHTKQQRQNHKAIRRGKSPHMPAWADKDAIARIYKEAKEKGLTVDHIVPLCNKLVCGLHWEGNLQLLTSEENSRKGNSFDINAAANIKAAGLAVLAFGE